MNKYKYLNKHTKNILEENLLINNPLFKDKKIILIYDEESELAKQIWESYANNLIEHENKEIIIFKENPEVMNADLRSLQETTNKEDLKNKLLNLEEYSMVILVQSTNFRLDDFRIRAHLQRINVWCIEHTHLEYYKSDEIWTYINTLSLDLDRYSKIWNNIKELFNKSNDLEIHSWNWSVLKITWWFEDVKMNTWEFYHDSNMDKWFIEKRYSTFPIWEVFTEARDFSSVNWEVAIYAFPDSNFQIIFLDKPIIIEIKESKIVSVNKINIVNIFPLNSESEMINNINIHPEFIKVLEKIYNSEDNEIYIRELWFWMNTNVWKSKRLRDVSAYERNCWFHMSIWKWHNIYRKKFSKKITQRFHIDIFPDVNKINLWWKTIFENWDYLV